ncbi:restriction endonuclease subunit S [Maritalea sp.]|uniref:restriction endonuclease subunit S n=1 Tax=Maritalea sp. TaxID=2003361 RepID=UPI003EF6A2B1
MTIKSYPKHERFKPSGFDWIGDIPDSWNVEKLGSALTEVSEKNCRDLPLLSITREQGVIRRDVNNQDSNHNFIPDDLSGYKLLLKGQFGMNKMKAWQGSYGVSEHTGIVSPAYYVFDFVREVDPYFFNIAIRSKLYVSYFGSASDGVRIGQWDLNKPRMRQIPILLPPLPEQRAIAAFLDGKCGTIDEAVRIKEKQVKLLAERRKILIQQAVTRGLNPNAPLKDSGIDWIGRIPVHWEVKQLKHVLSQPLKYGANEEALECVEGDPRYIRITDFGSDGSLRDETKRTLPPKVARDYLLQDGDILLARSGGTVGKSFLFAEGIEACFAGYLIRARSNRKLIESSYLNTFFRSPSFEHWKELIFSRATIQNIGADKYGALRLPLPPLKEQREIQRHVEVFNEKIDAAIAVKQSQITALREYKISLIDSAVTGNIKVI